MSTNPDNNNNDGEGEKPELLTFEDRRKMYAQNLQNQQIVVDSDQNTSLNRRRLSAPANPTVRGPHSRPPTDRVQTTFSPTSPTAPNDTPPHVEARPQPTPQAKHESSTADIAKTTNLPASSTSVAAAAAAAAASNTKESMSGAKKSRVIWVKPDVRPENPIDSRGLTPEQIANQEEAFKLARQRRASDSQVTRSTYQRPEIQLLVPPPSAQPVAQPVQVKEPPPNVNVIIPPPPAIIPPVQPEPVKTTPTPPPPAAEEFHEPIDESKTSTVEIPSFGSAPISVTQPKPEPVEEPVAAADNDNDNSNNDNNNDNQPGRKKKNEEMVTPQAFKNAFAFFQSLSGNVQKKERRMTEDGSEVQSQIEVEKLEEKLGMKRKRALTDNNE